MRCFGIIYVFIFVIFINSLTYLLACSAIHWHLCPCLTVMWLATRPFKHKQTCSMTDSLFFLTFLMKQALIKEPPIGSSLRFSNMQEIQLKTIVLFSKVRIFLWICFSTARESTIFSRSRPLCVKSAIVSLWETRVISCSIIGPASSSAVT